MRRNSSRSLLAAVGAACAAVLLIAGGLLLWGSAYVHNTVQGQLASQQIYFPPAAAFAHPKAGTEITPSMIPSVSQYAGQQMLTGQLQCNDLDHATSPLKSWSPSRLQPVVRGPGQQGRKAPAHGTSGRDAARGDSGRLTPVRRRADPPDQGPAS